MTTTSSPQLATVNPADLGIVDQVRADATPDDALIASVRAHGILQPPIVRWDAEQLRYVIAFGHRRVGAAIAAGLTEITVIVRDDITDGTAELLEGQIVENENRTGLKPTELARGWADLEGLFGKTPEDIAAETGESADRVRAGIRAVRSPKTVEALEEHPAIDLATAAVIAEFDDDAKVQKELLDVATNRPRDFAYRVQAIRDKRELTEARQRMLDELTAQGVKTIKVDQWGALPFSGTPRALGRLRTPAGKSITVKQHEKCAGHRGYVEGYSVSSLEVGYACADPEQYGHVAAHEVRSPEEIAEAAAREERDALIAANCAARRAWIVALLPGKINQLAGVYEYMAAALLARADYYQDAREPRIVLPLLGEEAPETERDATDALDALIATKRIAPFRLMLATSLAIHERACERGNALALVRHFEQLQRWGYQTTDIDDTALAAARERIADTEAADALEED